MQDTTRTAAEPRELLTVGGAVFGSEYVGMLQEGRLLNVVNRRDIKSIIAKYGFQAKHPLALFMMAVLLLLIAIAGAVAAFRGLADGATIVVPAVLAVGFCVPAVVCMRNAFMRGYYLDVFTDSGRTRIGLAQTIGTTADLAALVAVAKKSGYLVTIDPSARRD